MKRGWIPIMGVCLVLSFSACKQLLPYQDTSLTAEQRAEDLLPRLTLEEKVSLMQNASPAIPRLGIKEYEWWNEALHGVGRAGLATVFPQSIGMGASFNDSLLYEVFNATSDEARVKSRIFGESGVLKRYQGLTFWTPNVNIFRDPRWGRVAEGYGEDPYANGVFAAASVRGYQGDDMSAEDRIAACLKHYIGYGASEAGRDYVYTEISAQTLWDTYLLPYEMGVKAGAATLMSSFNDISGVPGSANHYTMTEILKERWGHDGFIVSDWGAIEQLKNQGLAANKKEAAVYAFNAGLEMDMMSHAYDRYMKELVEEGKITMAQVDESVRRVLRVKFRLGLFERPYTPVTNEEERFFRPQSMDIAAQLAAESMVLLKNENGILPLTDKKKIAVVGPMAKNGWDLLGSWCGHGKDTDVAMLYNGLATEFVGKAELRYALGCSTQGDNRKGFEEALEAARWSDVVVLCLGEMMTWSGENASRSSIALPQIQEELAKELKKAGKPIVLVLVNGRPLELNRLEPISDAILEIWQPGVNGALPMAGILSGRINPSGKLAMTFPYSTGQIPIYYNRRKSGRGHQGFYKDITSEPLYSFGHGLSYTEFKYGTVTPSVTTVKRGGKLSVEVSVSNTGKRDGLETVHWFISDPYCSITRPVKELKHFEKQLIKAGETKVFRFDVDLERDFGFVDGNGKRFLEIGEYYIQVKDQKVKIDLTE